MLKLIKLQPKLHLFQPNTEHQTTIIIGITAVAAVTALVFVAGMVMEVVSRTMIRIANQRGMATDHRVHIITGIRRAEVGQIVTTPDGSQNKVCAPLSK